MTVGVHHIASFLMAASLLIIVPGPATLHVVSRAQVAAGRAVWSLAGIVAGDVVLIGLSGLGFAALVTAWPTLLLALKTSGALYVAWLGIGLLRAADGQGGVRRDRDRTGYGGFAKGLLITLSNPKPILFFSVFFPVFIDSASRSWMGSFYLLGGLFEALNLLWFACLIVVVSGLRHTAALSRLAAGSARKAIGGGLLLCAASILVDEIGRAHV